MTKKDYRPLRTASRLLTHDMRANPTCRRHYIGIALGWMSRGYQYDTRTCFQRMTDRNARYFWLRALGVSHNRAAAACGVQS